MGFEGKHIMEKNGFGVPGGGGLSGDGDWDGWVDRGSVGKLLRNFRNISERFPGTYPENHRVVR